MASHVVEVVVDDAVASVPAMRRECRYVNQLQVVWLYVCSARVLCTLVCLHAHDKIENHVYSQRLLDPLVDANWCSALQLYTTCSTSMNGTRITCTVHDHPHHTTIH